MERLPAEAWDFGTVVKLRVDNNGYHYLEIRGILLEPYHGSCLNRREARIDTEQIRKWVNLARHACLVDPDLRIQASDRIWLTELRSSWPWEPEALAFLLRRHNSIPSFCDEPVYTLYSCFQLKLRSQPGIDNAFSGVRAASSELKQDLAVRGILLDADFYLG